MTALSDSTLSRCPDIFAFHFSLNRHFSRNYDFVGETHPFYELVYVVSGSVGVTAGDEVYTLFEGQMLLHDPDEFHRIWTDDKSDAHVLNLSFYAASMPFCQGRVLEPELDEREELLVICDGVQKGLISCNRAMLNEQRMRLELWLLRMMGKGGSTVAPLGSASALRYAEIANLLRAHLHESLTAQDIARMSNMSLSSLKKIFSRYAGMGVVGYFTEMKMRRAVVLLKNGMRVGEVASALGYADQNYFSTVFHRVMGVVPGFFRANE